MKKLFSLLLVLLLPVMASAQSKSEHLSFMGIPLDGKVAPFIEKLKAKGLTHLGNIGEGVDALEGTHLGDTNSRILVHYTPKTKQVYAVTALMHKHSRWADVEAQYKALKDSLRKEYGEPTESVERFNDPSIITDEDKMEHVLLGQCYYDTSYSPGSGLVNMRVQGRGKAVCVVLIYADATNMQVMEQEMEHED